MKMLPTCFSTAPSLMYSRKRSLPRTGLVPAPATPGSGYGRPPGPVYVQSVLGTTFLAGLRPRAEADPGRPALTCGDETLTRAEFVTRVERLAALFADHGVTQGSTVTIGLPNSIGFVQSMFAAWAVGAVPQPISDRLPPLERAAIVDLANPALVVESVPLQLPAGSFMPGVSPQWKLMTSGGSTGRPKLIAATEPALAENVVPAAYHLAAPCPAWLKQAWIDWLGPHKVFELYGGTELQAVTVISGTEWLAHRGSVGRTVLGEIEIRDFDGRPVPPGEEGEIWMRRGPEAALPYRYIGATARSAPDGWESLGDIGKVDADGYVYITDRLADMILVGGANVYPAEIEAALDEHPAVQSCCVIGLPDEDLGNIPYAIVELAGPVSDAELLAHLRQRLAPYKLPRVIERATTPLRDDAGKVRRSALRAERLPR